MFKFLRSQAKIIYWVIAATFILFLFLGGMTGRGCQSPTGGGNQYGSVGSVNGTQLSAQFLEEVFRQHLARLKQQSPNRELTANDYATLRDQAWRYLIQQALLEQAYKDYDIQVTDAEVLDVFQNNPLPQLLYRYQDAEGNVEMERYFADLQNPEVDWSGYETYVRETLTFNRLQAMVTADALVTEDLVRQEFIRQTGRAVAEYMGVLFGDLDQDFTPTDEDLLDYFEAHRDDFEAPAQVSCQVATFAKEPGPADLQEVLSFIQEIREEIMSGKFSFETAAREYSEDGSAASGGELGTFDRERMVAPFTEAAFSLQEGEISEPVKTKFGYHLIEVLERHIDTATGEAYQVHARHILLKVTPSLETLGLLRDSVEEFRSRVDGSTFTTTAQAEAVELMPSATFPQGQNIPGLNNSFEGSLWCATVKAGQISPMFENQDCMYIVLAEGVVPEGPAAFADVSDQVALNVKKVHERELALAKLSPAVGEVQMGRDMADVAAEADLKFAVTDTFTANDNISDVGWRTDFNLAALEGQVGQLIPEVETVRGLFALVPLWINPFDDNEFASRQTSIRQLLLNRAQGEAFNQWLEEQTTSADIVDLRH